MKMKNNYHKLNIIGASSFFGVVWLIGVVYNLITGGTITITYIFIALVTVSLSVILYQSIKE